MTTVTPDGTTFLQLTWTQPLLAAKGRQYPTSSSSSLGSFDGCRGFLDKQVHNDRRDWGFGALFDHFVF